jgi:ribosome-binding protein aMBF1 (putative translation factor)
MCSEEDRPWCDRHRIATIGAMPAVSPRHAYAPVLVAFGAAVRRARQERGLSQEELAHRAGIDRSYMSSIERGGQNLGLMSIARIARAMDMAAAELLLEARL